MGIFNRKTAEPQPTVLTAATPAVSLTKGTAATIHLRKDTSAVITAHLDWDGGNDSRRARGADLELYALHVAAADVTGPGQRKSPGGAIYYRRLGDDVGAPYIRHHGDSPVPGRETVTIARPDQHGYVLICAYSAVGNGVGSFKSFGARAFVTDGQGQDVTVPLFDNSWSAYWVAIALIDFTDPHGVTIRQVEEYSKFGTEKRPVLYSDGTFAMGAGPVEFKR